MSTPANIYIRNVDEPFIISVSHDGNPYTVLRYLAAFYELPRKQRTYHALRDIIWMSYTASSRKRVQILNVEAAARWEYRVDANWNLKVRCHELWCKRENAQKQSDPYDVLQVIRDDSKEDIRGKIDDAIERLHAKCITTMRLPEVFAA